jgi:hypothetical protein
MWQPPSKICNRYNRCLMSVWNTANFFGSCSTLWVQNWTPCSARHFYFDFHQVLSYLQYRYEYGKILNSLRSWRMPIHHVKKLVCGEHKHKICPAIYRTLPRESSRLDKLKAIAPSKKSELFGWSPYENRNYQVKQGRGEFPAVVCWFWYGEM